MAPSKPPRLELTPKQRSYLVLLESGCAPATAARRAKVQPRDLARWPEMPGYARRLDRWQRLLAHRRRIALTAAATEAAELLASAVRGDDDLPAARLRACIDLLKLVPAAPPEPPAPPVLPVLPVHEASDPADAARLVRALEGGAA